MRLRERVVSSSNSNSKFESDMILISNKQRDDIVKYIDLMCEALTGSDNRTYNTKRLARKLAKQLRAKQPLPDTAKP